MDTMETRRLGITDMQITPLGLGAWAIGGGGWQYGWGHSDDRESVATIHRALEHGINWIDTAPVYGVGHSEEVVGRAVKEWGGARPYVVTKCGLHGDKSGAGVVTHSLKAESVRRECEASLGRLGLDAIDLYLIHWPNPEEDIEEAWETMAALRDEGKVRHIGVSNFSAEQIRRLQPIAPVEALQPPYALIRREIEPELLPLCAEEGIGVIVYSPMMSGLLTGAMTRERVTSLPADDWRRRDQEYQEPRLSQNLELVELLREIGGRHGRSPGEVAVAWALRRPEVSGAIIGARRPDQIDGIVGAAGFRLSEGELAGIETFLAHGARERAVGG
jgi:aryl-alcohol dehydrogenase-like predicted oxidoreductase